VAARYSALARAISAADADADGSVIGAGDFGAGAGDGEGARGLQVERGEQVTMRGSRDEQ
jgi:hypothetical protein